MAHDFLGNELSIGDDVVFLNYNGTSADLKRGKITRVSEHTAEISGKRRAEYKIIKVNPVKPTMDNTWIPCSERLPEEGQDVLCWYQYFRYGNYNRLWKTYGIGFQYNGSWGGEVSGGRDTKVLFWMPLPEPPEEGGNKNAAD